MDRDTYCDKVYGCWLGKSIGGTIGAPLEGRREFLDVPLEWPKENIANDDLDLQLVWLGVLREKGLRISAFDLAEAWLEHISYPWDEYGVAIANLTMGLRPPVTGFYNNWFKDCMGAPIRSEIWAALFPGRPEVAGYYAYLDAQVDHWDEGVYGEVFFACLESLAFVGSDVRAAIHGALAFLPTSSAVRHAVELALTLANHGGSLREAREAVLERFGHHNFTHCVQNIAFTVLGLLYGEQDFLKSIVSAASCGYDVDCTAATAGAIAGILLGREKILEKAETEADNRIAVGWGIRGCGLPDTLEELTNWTVELGEAATAESGLPVLEKPFRLPDLPAFGAPCRLPFLVSPPVPLSQAEAKEPLYTEAMDETCREVTFDTYYFHFTPLLGNRPPEALFLSTHFRAAGNRTLKLFPASTDGIKLWLDGELVLSWSDRKTFLPAPHRPGSPLVSVDVEAGWHRVLIEVVARSVSPQFAWIVADGKNHHVVDLEYSSRR